MTSPVSNTPKRPLSCPQAPPFSNAEEITPEWEKHPEKFTYYLVGNPDSRFAITRSDEWRWRFPWQRPRGGWWLGRILIWWST